jgi:hypothetical protein
MMKKRFLLLIPIIAFLTMGLFMIPVKAETVNDAQDDVFGMRTWTEDGNPKVDCSWLPTNYSMIDIQAITWVDAGSNFTVSMTFYGEPNATLLEQANVSIVIMFLINGTTYPEDLATDSPDYNLLVTSEYNGTVVGDALPVNNIMNLSGNSLIWSFPKTVTSLTPVTLDLWDLLAVANYGYTENISDVIYTYSVFDHYNYTYLEDTYSLLCGILELEIPGYSLIAVGVVSVITISVIFKKKYKK